MESRIIKANYSPQSEKVIKLDDPIFVYNDGLKSKIISIDIPRYYPVIHDKYYHTDDIATDISVIICPYTLFAVVLEGIWHPTDEKYNENIIIEKNQIKYIPIKDQFSEDMKNIKKYEIRLMTHKNALMEYHDSYYLNISVDIKPLISEDYYYNNNIPSKSLHNDNNAESEYITKELIYIIEYKSNDGTYKKTVIIPKYNSFDIVKNGLNDYVLKYEEKLKEKVSYIMQCYSFAWIDQFKDSKIIRL